MESVDSGELELQERFNKIRENTDKEELSVATGGAEEVVDTSVVAGGAEETSFTETDSISELLNQKSANALANFKRQLQIKKQAKIESLIKLDLYDYVDPEVVDYNSFDAK